MLARLRLSADRKDEAVSDCAQDKMVARGTISLEDFQRIIVSDSSTDVVAHIRTIGLSAFNLSYGPRVKRRWYSFEKHHPKGRR